MRGPGRKRGTWRCKHGPPTTLHLPGSRRPPASCWQRPGCPAQRTRVRVCRGLGAAARRRPSPAGSRGGRAGGCGAAGRCALLASLSPRGLPSRRPRAGPFPGRSDVEKCPRRPGSLSGPRRGRGAVKARVPLGEGAVKLRGGEGLGRATASPGPGGRRRRQGGVEEGATASSTSSASVPRVSSRCRWRGKCEPSTLLEEGIDGTACTRVWIPGLRALAWSLDWIQLSPFPEILSVATLWPLGFPVTFFGVG